MFGRIRALVGDLKFIAWIWDHKMLRYRSYQIPVMESCMCGVEVRDEMHEKLQGCSYLSPLKLKPHVSEAELQESELALLGFSLALSCWISVLPWSNSPPPPAVSPYLSFGRGIGILCHCMLERCNLFSEFTRCHSKELPWVSEDTLDIWTNVGAITDYEDIWH